MGEIRVVKYDKKKFAIDALRRASYRWPDRDEAMRRARLERGIYKCACCEGSFKRSEINLDHVNPVIPLTGWDSFDSYIDRIFCDVDGWSVLCKPCHKSKTFLENQIRKEEKNNDS